MEIGYSIGVLTARGWRSVWVKAKAKAISPKMLEVCEVLSLDGEQVKRKMSRTGSRYQEYSGAFFAEREVGARKRLSCVSVYEDGEAGGAS